MSVFVTFLLPVDGGSILSSKPDMADKIASKFLSRRRASHHQLHISTKASGPGHASHFHNPNVYLQLEMPSGLHVIAYRCHVFLSFIHLFFESLVKKLFTGNYLVFMNLKIEMDKHN